MVHATSDAELIAVAPRFNNLSNVGLIQVLILDGQSGQVHVVDFTLGELETRIVVHLLTCLALALVRCTDGLLINGELVVHAVGCIGLRVHVGIAFKVARV
jgi:hypothetical protein